VISCRKLIKFLDDYVSGEMPEPLRRRFERHIKACRACRAYVDSYRATIDLEREALRCPESSKRPAPGGDPVEPMPDALVEAIMEACRKARREVGAGDNDDQAV